jgi:serine/threonine-protein kinase
MTERRIGSPTPRPVYQLGKYFVLAELGRGGMAEVFLALSRGQNGFNKLVVLKLLRSHLAEDEAFLAMFLAEARLAARLNHANIVQTYEVGDEGGRNCIVMEYLEGRSLANIESATNAKPLALNLGVRVMADTLAALHYAHELRDVDGRPLGLVHRDVSPHNLIVTHDGQVKLLDFGIAKAADDGEQTKTGVFKGKLRYTAPERFAADACDRRSDIFSVGVMLWQLLTRRSMWAGMNDMTVMQQLASRAPIPSPRSLVPDVPIRLDEICRKAIALSADDRFQTAAEMADALEGFLADESVGATNRALAKFMEDAFGEARRDFQRTVDEQIRMASSMPRDVDSGGSISGLRSNPALVLARGLESHSSVPTHPSVPRARGELDGSAPAVDEPLLASAAEAPQRRRRVGTIAALVAATALGVAVLVSTATIKSQQAPAPALAASAVVEPAASSPAETASAEPSPEPSADEPAGTESADVGARRAPHPVPGPIHVAAAAKGAQARAPAAATPPLASAGPVTTVPASTPPTKVDCSSPYFIDDRGIKTVRTECL